jgi:hypothetical protein
VNASGTGTLALVFTEPTGCLAPGLNFYFIINNSVNAVGTQEATSASLLVTGFSGSLVGVVGIVPETIQSIVLQGGLRRQGSPD